MFLPSLERYIINQIGHKPDGLEQVLSSFKEINANKNEILVEIGQTCKFCYFIVEGSLQLSTYNRNADLCTQDFALENSWITAIRSFINRQPSNEILSAIEPSKLLAIHRDDFQKMVDNVPQFEGIYRNLLEKSYSESTQRITTLLAMDATERVKWLLSIHPLIFNRFSNKFIASYLGLKPETLSRVKSKVWKH